MKRVIAYCGFLRDQGITPPERGVDDAPVYSLVSAHSQLSANSNDQLQLLWSEVEWPFDQKRLQQNALQFHSAVQHVFERTAVVPFRLLSIFDDLSALQAFAAEHAGHFVADLVRLRDYVQMESVVYIIAPRPAAEAGSGRAYLEQKAGLQRTAQEHAAQVKDALNAVSRDIQVRQVKNGSRIFALVRRGEEELFRRTVDKVALPGPVSRRVTGPWPAAEFLSQAVKAPPTAAKE